jgi:hypothetical protein
MNRPLRGKRTVTGLAGLLLALGLATTAPLLLPEPAAAHSTVADPGSPQDLNGTGASCTGCPPSWMII